MFKSNKFVIFLSVVYKIFIYLTEQKFGCQVLRAQSGNRSEKRPVFSPACV